MAMPELVAPAVGGTTAATTPQAEICIIGAGSSGVAVAKALKERGLTFECFEKGSDIGGMWRYKNDNGVSSAYKSLHIDTSRENLGYSDFPIPEDKPDFLSHAEFLEHLEAYADRFGIRPLVTFRTEVTRVEPAAEGTWAVTLASGESRTYRSVIVANGHLWDPRWPSFPGRFDGEVIHSHYYRTAQPFEGKHVLVVGIGNSAVDIAVDLCRRAESVVLSTRRSAWVMPKYLMGIPVDRWSAFLGRKLRLPTRAVRMIMSRLIRLAVGNQERFGVRRPDHPMWREHATLSQELLPYVGHGRIRIKPNIRELQEAHVLFEDGTRMACDAIIYATGYRTTFPFLAPDVFAVEDSRPVPLYRRIAAPDRLGLYFVGLVQPIGPTIPLVEIQAKWLAGVLSGNARLPPKREMEAEIAQHRREVEQTYVGLARYTLEVDFSRYAKQLSQALATGTA
jgi:dimethylaniline monooxygenase (N-oxide forming)